MVIDRNFAENMRASREYYTYICGHSGNGIDRIYEKGPFFPCGLIKTMYGIDIEIGGNSPRPYLKLKCNDEPDTPVIVDKMTNARSLSAPNA